LREIGEEALKCNVLDSKELNEYLKLRQFSGVSISSFISNIAVDGSFLVAVNIIRVKEGVMKFFYGKLTLFDSACNNVWSLPLRYTPVFMPQISYHGGTITHLEDPHLERPARLSLRRPRGFRLVVRNKQGEERWHYNDVVDYALSSDGRHVALIQYKPKKRVGELVVLYDGSEKWREKAKSGRRYGGLIAGPSALTPRGKLIRCGVAMSPDGNYVATCGEIFDRDRFKIFSGFSEKKYRCSFVELYSTDGGKLWSVEVEGFVGHLNVTNRGEVFFAQCFNSKCSLFKAFSTSTTGTPNLIKLKEFDSEIRGIRLPPSGDIVVVLDNVGLHTFDKDGRHLWSLREPVVSFDASDDYIALTDGRRFRAVTFRGEDVVPRIKFDEVIWEVRISPDGKYIAVAGENHVYLFDVTLGERIKRIIAKLDELASI